MKSKKELEKEINEKNRMALSTDGALGKMVTYNLENFAYRYIETENFKDIKCSYKEKIYLVSSIEHNVYTALKWGNEKIKHQLIDLCKKYPGKKSKEIKIQLKIGSILKEDNQIECFACINWDFPNFESSDRGIKKIVKYTYSDELELRNKHASLLEDVCSIF